MPGPLSHTLFGREAYRQLEDVDIRRLLQEHWTAYLWGLQGPDLYYYPARIKKGYKLNRLGLFMHLYNTAGMLTAMGDYLASIKNTEEYDGLLSYCMGFLCHYCSDKAIHSYVFPKEKIIRQQRPDYNEVKEGGLHDRIESGIEWLFYQCRRSPNETMETIMQDYSITPPMMDSIEKMYIYIADTVYHINAKAEPFSLSFEAAFQCFGRHVTEVDVFLEDQLNLNRAPWEVFDSPGVFLNKSVFELYDIAREEALDLIKQLHDTQKQGVRFSPATTRNFSYWKFNNPGWIKEYYHL